MSGKPVPEKDFLKTPPRQSPDFCLLKTYREQRPPIFSHQHSHNTAVLLLSSENEIY